jgi:3',5'-nucleoside bisphosphate phosphatase
MLTDMHIHTTASDGSWTPEELILHTSMSNLELIAVTDHDCIDNACETALLANRNNIKYIAGVEISSTFNGSLYHILGYGIDTKDDWLREVLQHNTKIMEKHDDDSIKTLIDAGYGINFEDYVTYCYDKRRGGWKSLNFLIDKGICSGVGDYFGKLFCKERSPAFPVFPEPHIIIDCIKKSGGVSVLAHPVYEKIDCSVDDILNSFKEIGIEGIECYHPNHSIKDTKDCLRWCNANSMIITGGSDCHGDLIKARKLGMLKLDINMIRLGSILNKII